MEEIKALINLSIGMPKTLVSAKGKEMTSAICKEAVTEAFLSIDGFIGDGVADKKHHGGRDRAVCIYPHEHYAFWEQLFETDLPSSTFGENMTVSGMLEENVNIGDIYKVGDAVIQVTQGRVPCSTITTRTNLPHLMKQMVATGFTGYLCRVLEEGVVRSDSSIELLEPHPHAVSILFANDVYFHRPKDIESMERILAVDALAEEWRQSLLKRCK